MPRQLDLVVQQKWLGRKDYKEHSGCVALHCGIKKRISIPYDPQVTRSECSSNCVWLESRVTRLPNQTNGGDIGIRNEEGATDTTRTTRS